MLVFSPFALWHLFPSISSSSLHHTCVDRRDRLVSVFTICSMAPFSIYFIIVSSSYMRCVNRRDRLVCVFTRCSMLPFSIYFVIICSSVSECVCVLHQDSFLKDPKMRNQDVWFFSLIGSSRNSFALIGSERSEKSEAL